LIFRLAVFHTPPPLFADGHVTAGFSLGIVLTADGICDTLYAMKTSFQAVIERDCATGLLVGYVPRFPGAHSQGETLDELYDNLREVVAMLLEDTKKTAAP
jgi:predicted RNase H-like HicB family nuclease